MAEQSIPQHNQEELTMHKEAETYRILVVSLNKARLQKVLSLVHENLRKHDSESISIEFLPCVASLGSYESDDGSKIRFLSSFIYYDGSAMTKFFDDDNIRPSLSAVAMVGYEWKLQDKQQLENYFQANNLSLEIQCVHPNTEFKNLDDEMEFFKNLSEEEKKIHIQNQTMGPGKMAKLIMNMANRSNSR